MLGSPFSPMKKDLNYFKSHFFFLMVLLLPIIVTASELWGSYALLTPHIGSPASALQERIFASKFSPLYFLFFLDSNGSLKALFDSLGSLITFVVYNAPLMVVMFILLIIVPEFLNAYVWREVGYYYYDVTSYFFFWPVLINIWAVIYTKFRREQPELYVD